MKKVLPKQFFIFSIFWLCFANYSFSSFSSQLPFQGNKSLKNELELKLISNQIFSDIFWSQLDKYIQLSPRNANFDEISTLLDKIQNSLNRFTNIQRARYYLYRAINEKYKLNFPIAQNNFLLAKDIFKKSHNKKWNYAFYIEYAEFYRKLGYFDEAFSNIYIAQYYKNALPHSDFKLDNKFYNRLAAIFNEYGKLKQSIYYSKRALGIAKRNKLINEEGVSYNEIAFSFMNMKIIDSAEFYYRKSEIAFLKANNFLEGLTTKFNRAILYLHSNIKRVEAKKILLEVIETTNKYKLEYPLNTVYQLLIEESRLEKNKDAQLKYWQLYYGATIQLLVKREKSALIDAEKNFKENKLKLEKERIKNNLKTTNQQLTHTNQLNFLMVLILIILFIFISISIFFIYRTRNLNQKLILQSAFNRRMMAIISHDLKGSLYLLSILGKKLISKEEKQVSTDLISLNRQIATSNDILDSLLKWLKTSFTKAVDHQKIEVDSVWEIVQKEFQDKIHEKGIEVKVEALSNSLIDLPPGVLRIAIRNVLSNAIKYSYDHSTIIVRFKNNCFQIQDFGTGIEADRLQNLLNSDVISVNGTFDEAGFGIGLYMTQNMLLEYGFKIIIESMIDEGTTITITK